MSDNCPVCETALNKKTPTRNAAFSTYAYDCPRCGKFVFRFEYSESRLAEWLNYGQDEDKKFILSHYIRKIQNKGDSEVFLDANLVEKILKGALPTPTEQKDIFIRWVGDNIKAGGDYIKVNSFSIQAIIGAKTLGEFYFILDHLKKEEIIESKAVVGGGDTDIVMVTLSIRGWEYYDELKRGDTNSRKTFMAMESIPKQQADEIHDSSNENTSMEWDIFICHASEDKGDFVEPLANALEEADIKVWYDRFELKLGDSLRDKIDKGLANSRYGVVVLSRSFFKKNWTRTELNALVSRENQKGEKVILPIWHKIGIEEVKKHSPILASKLAAQSSDSLESIVAQIVNVLKGSSAPQKSTKDKRETAETKKPTPATSIEKLLTDPGDITNKLIWWLGQQRGFVFTQTKCGQPVVWHFSVIDKRNNLSPGSAKKRLPEILNSNESPFPAIVKNVSSSTIRLEFDFSP